MPFYILRLQNDLHLQLKWFNPAEYLSGYTINVFSESLEFLQITFVWVGWHNQMDN